MITKPLLSLACKEEKFCVKFCVKTRFNAHAHETPIEFSVAPVGKLCVKRDSTLMLTKPLLSLACKEKCQEKYKT